MIVPLKVPTLLSLREWWRRINHTPLSDVLRGRLSGSLDYRVMVQSAGLPHEVQAAIIHAVDGAKLSRMKRLSLSSPTWPPRIHLDPTGAILSPHCCGPSSTRTMRALLCERLSTVYDRVLAPMR